MDLYRVKSGTLRIGSGDVLSLDAEQYKARRHNVSLIEELEDRLIVRPNVMLDFKTGEIVGIAGELPKVFLDQIERVGAAPAASEKPAHPAKAKPGR